jgi:hypothetical protein
MNVTVNIPHLGAGSMVTNGLEIHARVLSLVALNAYVL